MPAFADRMAKMSARADVTRALYNSMTNKNVISFGGGSPARDTFPVDELREIANDILRGERGQEVLAYNDPQGVQAMKEVVAEYMLPRRGINGASPEEVIIVNGGLETMNLTCQAFINKGDIILVEEPSFVQTIQIFDMFEAECIPVECDDDGIIVEDMIAKCEKYNPKMIYIITSFHNPAARTTGIERRKAIAEYVNSKDVILLEDDPYVELRYDNEDLPAIKAFDKVGNIVYANSFSKIFSPGARLGYCHANTEIIAKLYDAKTATNSQTSTIDQMLCAEYYKRGYYDKHIEECRSFYRTKRDAVITAIEKYFPEGTKILKPEGGLFVWVELPYGSVDTTELYEESVKKINVAFLAGRKFFINEERGKYGMRLSFGSLSLEQIDGGLKALGGLIKEKMEK
ncbi:MAG: PLP-dependent aminotransferase family protein [Eubacteriales bacterium]|nr:PLP-dependent aminotransferase family protein [Eubacteriales bacterium]